MTAIVGLDTPLTVTVWSTPSIVTVALAPSSTNCVFALPYKTNFALESSNTESLAIV